MDVHKFHVLHLHVFEWLIEAWWTACALLCSPICCSWTFSLTTIALLTPCAHGKQASLWSQRNISILDYEPELHLSTGRVSLSLSLCTYMSICKTVYICILCVCVLGIVSVWRNQTYQYFPWNSNHTHSWTCQLPMHWIRFASSTNMFTYSTTKHGVPDSPNSANVCVQC